MRFTLFSCALLLLVINSSAQISTAENGLNTPNSTTVRLGGTLLQTTNVDLGSSYDFNFLKGSAPYFTLLNNGNVGIGTNAPQSLLHVAGDAWVVNKLKVGNFVTGNVTSAGIYTDGQVRAAGGFNLRHPVNADETFSGINFSGSGVAVWHNNGSVGIFTYVGGNSNGSNFELSGYYNSGAGASGYVHAINIDPVISPNNNSVEYRMINITPDISSLNGATGKIRGLYIDPTYHAQVPFTAIETTSGNVLFHGGKVGIGTSAPHNTFEVNTDGGDDNTPYIPHIWDTYSSRFNGGNVSIFSTGNSTTTGDSYQLSFYSRYYNNGQGTVTNKAAFIKGSVMNDDNLYPGQSAGRGILVLGSTNTDYNDGVLKFNDIPAVYLNNAQVGIGINRPTGRLHIKASTTDATASDFLFTDNAGGNILSIRNDQKFTLGSGTQNTQLSIAGTGSLSGIYSPAYGAVASNIIAFRDNAGNTRMTLDMSSGTDGKLGIGTTNIGTAALAIEKSNNDGGATNAPVISVKNTSTTQPAGSGYNIAGANFFAGNGAVLGQCSANYGVGADAPWNSGNGFYVTTRTNDPIIFAAASAERMRIGANGNVGIGTTNINDASYKLFVEGNIRTRKVRVDHDNWPDYVFENNYPLTPLHEVEQYIQQQKHLPEVPSAAEVKKEGVDVGDNQAVLLKKIEELTLYVIQQQKQLEEQQKKIEALEKKMADKN